MSPSPLDTDQLRAVLRTLDAPGSLGTLAPPSDRPGGFADRALSRAAARRRRHGALAAAGAAVAAALVVLTVVLVPGAQDRAAPATNSPADVFAQPRQNVLLLGSDAGPGRVGTRPDTIMLASIDTRTGATVMIGLPRNLERVPFPAGTQAARAWPDGFVCDLDACLLNSVWQWAETTGRSFYPGVAQPGRLATLQAVEGITGQKIDQSVVVSMKGLQQLVDAIGGVEVTVRQRLPIGGTTENQTPTGGWIEPGKHRLNGYQALWYARSRWSSNDFDRMSRAQCLITNVIQQTDVSTLITRYPQLVAALTSNLQTTIPAGDLKQWGDLVMRMRTGGVVMLPLIPPDRDRPDYDAIRATIAAAIAKASAKASAGPASGGSASGSGSAAVNPAPQASTVPTVPSAC